MTGPEPAEGGGGLLSAHRSSAEGLLTADEVASLLSVPKSWVYAETRAGRMPHVQLGPRYRRYERRLIEAWWADLRRGPTVYRKYAPGSQPEGFPSV